MVAASNCKTVLWIFSMIAKVFVKNAGVVRSFDCLERFLCNNEDVIDSCSTR